MEIGRKITQKTLGGSRRRHTLCAQIVGKSSRIGARVRYAFSMYTMWSGRDSSFLNFFRFFFGSSPYAFNWCSLFFMLLLIVHTLFSLSHARPLIFQQRLEKYFTAVRGDESSPKWIMVKWRSEWVLCFHPVYVVSRCIIFLFFAAVLISALTSRMSWPSSSLARAAIIFGG